MRLRFWRFFRAVLLISGGTVFLIAMSFSRDWSLGFDSNSDSGPKEGSYQQRGLLTGPMIEVDAEKIFGENMSLMLHKIVLNYLMVKNPEGPQTVSTSSLTNLDRLKLRTLGGFLLVGRANQELKIYQESDLAIVPDSPLAVENYLASLKKIFDERLEWFRGEDLATLAYQAEAQDDANSRKKLIDFINQTHLALEEFVQVPVPQSWKLYHLGLLNLYSEAQYIALSFFVAGDDPYRARFAYAQYDKLAEKFFAFDSDFKAKQREYLKKR